MDPQRFELCADQISRIFDNDDYSIKDDVFAYIDEAWGPHTIDRFIITRNLVRYFKIFFSLRQMALMLSRKVGLTRQIGYVPLRN